MLKQKRKAQSPPTCIPCRRQRTDFNCDRSCDECTETFSPDPPSYRCNMNSRSETSSENLTDNRAWAHGSAMPRAFDLSGMNVAVDRNEWLHIQEELKFLRAQHRKFMAVRGLIRARNWVALDVFGSQQPEERGYHEPRVTVEKMKAFMTDNSSHTGQQLVCSAQPGYEISPLPASHLVHAGGHALQTRSQPLATPMPTGPVQDAAGLSNEMMTTRNSYTWRNSPFNPTSPTPSLTLTRSSSVSIAPPKPLWTGVAKAGEIESRQSSHISQWSFEAMPSQQQQNEMLEESVTTRPNPSKTVTAGVDLQWRDTNISTMPVPSNLPLFFDPESDPEFDLDLASAFAIHPPMVRPEWRSPQLRPAALSKREPVMLPNLSSHAPCGATYPAQWSTELAPAAVHPAIDVSNDCLMYATPTPTNPTNSSFSESPYTLITPVEKPAFKELPIRFTQSMYNTLKDFSLPPSMDKDSPFVNDSSHFAHGSFKPRQYNPGKDYIIQTRDPGVA